MCLRFWYGFSFRFSQLPQLLHNNAITDDMCWPTTDARNSSAWSELQLRGRLIMNQTPSFQPKKKNIFFWAKTSATWLNHFRIIWVRVINHAKEVAPRTIEQFTVDEDETKLSSLFTVISMIRRAQPQACELLLIVFEFKSCKISSSAVICNTDNT